MVFGTLKVDESPDTNTYTTLLDNRSLLERFELLGLFLAVCTIATNCNITRSQAINSASPWETLGVERTADKQTIRRAYRKLALK